MSTNLTKARNTLEANGYTCVICRDNSVLTDTRRGIRPLMELLENSVDLSGYSAADKVIGKAAAFLYHLLGGEAVHAQVISQPAADIFCHYGIKLEYGCLVPAIRNRDNTGFCPMESAVLHIDDPEEALAAVRQTLANLEK